MSERIHVAVGIIYNKTRDKVLISKRKENQHLAGLWEFPGGKLNQAENVRTALDRELHEELGIVVRKANRFKTIKYEYSDKNVLLDVWTINEWTGEVSARENQEITWAHISKLNDYKFPEANQYIISSILLPSTYLISKDSYDDGQEFLSSLESFFDAGLKLFQLRLKFIKPEILESFIYDIKFLTDKYDAKFILNGTAKDIELHEVDGIHLNSKELFNYESRPINKNYLLGASCHNEEEVLQANKINTDYIFVSPVLPTKSHPDSKAIGWQNFNKLCEKSEVPVYALGGLHSNERENAITNGAHGIAMVGAIWDAPSPVEAIRYSIN